MFAQRGPTRPTHLFGVARGGGDGNPLCFSQAWKAWSSPDSKTSKVRGAFKREANRIHRVDESVAFSADESKDEVEDRWSADMTIPKMNNLENR